VKRTVREYLDDIEEENRGSVTLVQQDKISTTDPDSTYYSKGDRSAKAASTEGNTLWD